MTPSSFNKTDPVIGDITGPNGEVDASLFQRGHANDLEYAGFWIRLGATLIDTILLLVITTPLLLWVYGWGYISDGRLIRGPAEVLISYVAPTVATVLLWLGWQATPGKMLFSLRVVDADSGNTLSLGQAAARSLCYIISMLPLCLGFIWVGVDRRKQGWHDKIAQSVVVRAKDRGPEAVRFQHGSIRQADWLARDNQAHRARKHWIVAAALAAGALLVAGWAISLPEVRMVPWRTVGLLTEYRSMQVPLRQPYPPGTVCYDGFLEHVDVQARTTYQVKDDQGRRIPCLP